MKNIIIMLLSAVLLLTTAGCNKTPSEGPNNTENNVSSDISQKNDDKQNYIENTDLKLDDNSHSADFRTRYIFEFYGMHDFVASLVDENILLDWKRQFENGERSLWELNLFTMVQELNISKEALSKSNADNGALFSDEQIASLYSGDIKKVNECFANPYAILCDGEIFTPDWLATHTANDYIKAGITPDDLKEYLSKINITELSFAYIPIVINANAMDGFDEKIVQSDVEISVHIISANGREITVKETQYGKEYFLKLLFEPDHTPAENAFYWIRGRYDFINDTLNIETPEGFHCPQRYAHTDNSDWALSVYADDVTDTGLTVKFELIGAPKEGHLQTGEWYEIEKHVNDEWQKVETIISNYGFNALAYLIKENDITEFEVNWEWLYGKLSPGYYRIKKEVINFRETGDFDKEIFEVHFTIE